MESDPGVTVLVGGRDRGTTVAATNKTDRISEPLEIKDIPIGQQELVFFRKGYAEQKRMVEIKRDEVATLETVQLIRQFIPDVEVTTQIGVYRGVFVDKTDEIYRIETDPGVIRSFMVNCIGLNCQPMFGSTFASKRTVTISSRIRSEPCSATFVVPA